MDFLRGVSELASAIAEGRTSRLSPRFSLHITELALAIQHAGPAGCSYVPESDFEPMRPMIWAEDQVS